MPRLVVNPTSPQAFEIQLKPGANSLGRSEENDFAIEDASVSSTHCRLTVDQDRIWIEDLGSSNGTFVRDQRVGRISLHIGQCFRLGNVEMRLQPDPPSIMSAEQVAAGAEMASSPQPSPPKEEREKTGALVQTSLAQQTGMPGKPTVCKNHYQNLARYECRKCKRYLCDLCVNTRGSGAGGLKFCKVCGQECATLSIETVAPPVDFYAAAKRAFKYPFIGDGLILMFGGLFFFCFLDAANFVARHALKYGLRAMMMRAVIISFILGTGYLFAFLTKVITSSAMGEESPPDWPEISEWKADIVSPMFQFVSLFTVCFGPAIALECWFEGEYEWLVGVVAVVGCIYFPMAFLGVAMFDSLTALNPIFVIGSITRAPRPYAVAVLVMAGIIGIRWLSETGLFMMLHIPLVPPLIADLIAIVLLITEARILGVLYLAYKNRLGWFRH